MKKLIFLVFLLFSSTVFASDVIPYLAPDNSYGAFKYFLSQSNNNLVIGVYEFTSHNMAQDLIDSKKNITVMVEKSPVGGLIGEDVLCAMQKKGIKVWLTGAYNYMHAKYAISGDTVLIGTENFGETGYPTDSTGNRGWGVIIKDREIAGELRNIFYIDLSKSVEFECRLKDYELHSDDDLTKFTPRIYENQSITLLAAPPLVAEIIDIINSSKSSIKIEQHYIHRHWGSKKNYTPNLFLEAAIEKSREGKNVKILLDSIWFNVDKDDPNSNYYTDIYINEIAEKESLPLQSRLIDLEALELEKAHIKGVIIDDNIVFLSSVNWGENSPTENREIGVLIKGDSAEYFLNAFNNDWIGKKTALEKEGDNTLIIAAFAVILIIVILIIVYFYLKKGKE